MAKKIAWKFKLLKYTNDSDCIVKQSKTVTIYRADSLSAENYARKLFLRPVGFESIENVANTRVWDAIDFLG